ncbi:MAG: hypothetical protein ACLGH8_00835 [Bacteroidia bacterium]
MFCAIALSCSDDADTHSISGSWYLTNTTTPEGNNLNYREGEVTWEFSEKSGTLTVQNRIVTLGPENTLAGPGTGSYRFELRSEQNIHYLYIDGSRIGAVANTGENLVVSSGIDNGIVKVFRR